MVVSLLSFFSMQSLGSVPHRDFQLSAQWHHPESSEVFQPLSTPTSREVRARLTRSRRKEVIPWLPH